jgi:vancomycin permeability regulator SanA
MNVSTLQEIDLTNELIDRILYKDLEDHGFDGDCIMVLGSMKAPEYRVPKAVSIYHDKRASKILLCGGKIRETSSGLISEAQLMRNKALELGVPDEDILLDEVSMSTKENMICSLLPLERSFKLSCVKRILLVTTSYHMRRSILMAQTYLPSWIEIVACPAEDRNTRRHNWYQTEKGYSRAKDEVLKVISYIREGSVADFEI